MSSKSRWRYYNAHAGNPQRDHLGSISPLLDEQLLWQWSYAELSILFMVKVNWTAYLHQTPRRVGEINHYSPNFGRQAKIRWRTTIGEKDAINFNQQFVTLKWRRHSPSLCIVPNFYTVRKTPFGKEKLLILCLRKNVGEINHWSTLVSLCHVKQL